MTPRKPEESSEQDEQNRVLRVPPEAPCHGADAPLAPAQPNAPAVTEQQDKSLRTKVEVDRLELYLQGPTVFSA